MINQGLKQHALKFMEKGIRLDGRKLDEYRNVEVEYEVSNSAEGSARVRIGDTEVIVGIKMVIEKPYPDTPGEGGLMVGAELLPLSNPDFESGPPSIQAIELARVVDRGIRESKAIDTKKLCIVEGEKGWFISVDICTINDAGNLFDASSLATIAALTDTRFPKFDGEKVDYKERTEKELPLLKMPIEVTVFKIGTHFIVDPTSEEERIFDARLTVASTENGELCALQKGGDSPLTTEEINHMVEIALDKAKELREYLKGEA